MRDRVATHGAPNPGRRSPLKQRVRSRFDQWAPTYDAVIHPYFSSRRREILSSKATGRILEIGCGSGKVTEGLVQRGNVFAVDLSPEMAKGVRSKLGVPTVAGDGEQLPFRQGVFDTVIAAEVLCYLEDPAAMIREAFRVLRTGGSLAASIISQHWMILDRLRTFMGRLGFRVGSHDDCYTRTFHRGEIVDLFRQAGFGRVRSTGILFFPTSALDSINRILERTTLDRFAMDHVVWAVKGTPTPPARKLPTAG